MEKKFGIKVISNSCGILPHTLRVWEQRYQVFQPERAPNGQRLYSKSDLEKAKLIARLLEHGHSISSLAGYSNPELDTMIELIEKDTKNTKDSPFIHSISTKNLLMYLSDYKIDLVAAELQHLRLSVGSKEFIFKIILPIMREIGLLVAKGKYTVSQEHIISTIVRGQLSQIYLPNVGPKSKEMVLATPEGNLHELSIIIGDILCRSNRLTTRYLGATHPADCLGQAVNALKSPYLVLGVITSDQWNYHDHIIPYLSKIDAQLDENITVILGGGSPMDFPEFKHIEEVIIFDSLEKFDKFLEDL
ncbi:MerR family transcriptional regulator [Bacteriovoracaceae bacterium]|nr:MerR family transcriptional regulator [Bacteriovoracaceae bacterium]